MASAHLEIAGGCANKSGQRFLDSSAPRHGRHASPCNIPAGSGIQAAAGVDEKLSQGTGQRPVVSARFAPCLGSLDEVQIKRDRPDGWKKSCSRWSVRGDSQTEAGKVRYCRVGCKCWGCSGCGPRRASMFCIRISQTAERLKLNKLLTLTLDPAKLNGADSTKYINEVFADFRVYLRRKLGRAPSYIRVLEYQKNGNAHLHILLRDWLDHRWVSEAWEAVGGGRIVDIRFVDMHRVSHYLSKYLTKQMLECAPPRARRVTTSRDIRLLEKQESGFAWIMLRVPLLRLFDRYSSHKAARLDQDGYLVSFDVYESPGEMNEFQTAVFA